MNKVMKDILFFLFKVIITCYICAMFIRVYVWYYNKPVSEIANILFYLALTFLIVGFLSILITFIKSTFNYNPNQAPKNHSYKSLLNFTTLVIVDGIIFILVSFLLTFLFSFQTSV